jgi:hypothetical protein
VATLVYGPEAVLHIISAYRLIPVKKNKKFIL